MSKQTFRAPPEQAVLFHQHLAPYRPAGSVRLNERGRCKTLTEDLSEVSVSWSGPGRDDRLAFAFGCDFDTRASRRFEMRLRPSDFKARRCHSRRECRQPALPGRLRGPLAGATASRGSVAGWRQKRCST